jgi:hypothetical protein
MMWEDHISQAKWVVRSPLLTNIPALQTLHTFGSNVFLFVFPYTKNEKTPLCLEQKTMPNLFATTIPSLPNYTFPATKNPVDNYPIFSIPSSASKLQFLWSAFTPRHTPQSFMSKVLLVTNPAQPDQPSTTKPSATRPSTPKPGAARPDQPSTT